MTGPRVEAVLDEVVLEEVLPDGRRLLVHADGREVVVGRAGPRPHPVAGWSWLGGHPEPGPTPRRVARPAPPHPAIAPGAEPRAAALLRSLLDDGQRADYDRTGGFWVPTPRGPVRLGQLYALVHRPVDQPLVERILCVVPTGHRELPRADIWTNLLLTLAVDPERFFRVAVLQGVRSRRDRAGAARASGGWVGSAGSGGSVGLAGLVGSVGSIGGRELEDRATHVLGHQVHLGRRVA